MRLLKIRLHPFGRFHDESWILGKPLVVIHGPNEMGKSTLRQAIFHVLFTPTKLTPTQLTKALHPWFPLPAGDHAAVALTFQHTGSTWTLEKRWGAGQSSRLSDGRTTIADPLAVQARLAAMLAHGEATFRHVFFTGQGELERTLDAIRENAAELRDVRDLLRAAAGAAADVDEQRLRTALDAKIGEAFGRWDEQSGRPQRQNGQERGVTNPWVNGVGTVLEAWYAWQKLKAEQERLLDIEREIDRANREVAEIEQRIATATAFVSRFGGLRDGLSERGLLEERVPRLESNSSALAKAYVSWPRSELEIEAWERQRPTLEAERDALAIELENARARVKGAAVREAFTRIDEARQAWETADAEQNRHPDPGSARLEEISRLEAAIMAAESRLASRALSWRIEATESCQVTIERGMEPAATLPVGPWETTGTAEARVRVVAAGVTLTVESGADDVAAVSESLKRDRTRLAEELAACRASQPADVRRMAERHTAAAGEAEMKKGIYRGLLLDKTYEQWAEEVEALRILPGTRDVPQIEAMIEVMRKRLADGEAETRKHREAVHAWTQSYGAHAALGEALLTTRADLKAAQEKLDSLPELPTGFDSPQALLAELDAARADHLEAQQQLTIKKELSAGLAAQLADHRSEDLVEQAEAARRQFDRALVRGRAYLRIRQEIDRITADAEDDPIESFGDKVATIFARITGGEAALEFAGQLPARVVRGSVSLPPDRLSHGGGGALALAVRLAMAEAYLPDGDGFLMLDDPLVHFDPVRMGVAADVLRLFAEKSQVIVFTCHDHHAAQLER